MKPDRTPLWKSIADDLTARIADGSYQVGDKLPSEQQLAAQFQVNRHTVRHALKAMAEEDLVHSKRGAGVFVAGKPTEYQIGRRVRFHQSMRAAGQMPAKTILSTETRLAAAREAEALGLAAGARVHVYTGLSLTDGRPMALFHSTFPAERFPDILTFLQESGSVTDAFRRSGLDDYTRSSTRLTAVAATATEANLLELKEGAPLLRSVAVNVDVSGKPVEYGRTLFAGDRVTLTLSEDSWN